MRRGIGLILTTVLTLLLNVTDMSANNLTFVNATESAINVTAYFKQDTGGTLKQCVAQYYQTIQPGGVYSKDISGCLVKQVIVDIIGQGKSVWLDVVPSQRIDRGLFFVRPAVDCDEYVMEGPMISDPVIRKLYLINTTPYSIVINASPCQSLETYLDGFKMGIMNLPQNCDFTLNVNINLGRDLAHVTQSYKGNVTAEGALILGLKPGTTNQFQVTGPFSDK